MPARELGECFVGALQDALCADVDPAARRHLAVHRQAAILEIAEALPRRPCRHEQRVGDEDARRPGMRAEDGDGFAGLDDQRLVVLEAMQSADDGVEGVPAASGATGAAIDHEIVGTLGDIGIEIVHQHAERGFLRPSFAGHRRASGRADMAAERAHRAAGARTIGVTRSPCHRSVKRSIAGCRAEGSNLRTYARVVNLKLKNFLLDFHRDCGAQRSVRDERGNRFDVGRRRTIVGQRRHDCAHAVACTRSQQRRRRQRREQIDRLARAQDLDATTRVGERRARVPP